MIAILFFEGSVGRPPVAGGENRPDFPAGNYLASKDSRRAARYPGKRVGPSWGDAAALAGCKYSGAGGNNGGSEGRFESHGCPDVHG